MTTHYKLFLLDLLKVFGVILNAFIFFRIVTYTFIEVHFLLVGFLILVACGIILIKYLGLKINRYIFFIICVPAVFNSFFLVNYLFSKNEKVGKYQYQYGITDIQGDRGYRSSKKGRSTTIHLEGAKYEAFYFPRMFFDYENKMDKKTITYYLEDGFFGFMVMKDYVFSQNSNDYKPEE